MANSDRDIVISPDRGSSTDPTIRFTGADSLSSATIVLRVYNSGTDATLSFEGDVGQLFSITDSTLGPIFSVNDVTGIPSIEVLDSGEIRMAQYSGFVSVLGTTNATSTATGVFRVAGGVGIGRDTYIGGNLTVQGNVTAGSGTIFGTISTASTVVITDDSSNSSAHYLTFVSGTSGNLPLKVDSSALTFVPNTNNLGLGTTNPYTRLSIVSSSNTQGISLFTSAYEASRQWGTRIWKNDTGGGIPLQIETQEATTWYNSIRIGHGQSNTHPSLTTFYTTHLATTSGNVGIGNTSPSHKLDVEGPGRFVSNGSSRVLYLVQNATNAGNIIQFQDQAGSNIWEVVGRNNQFYLYNSALSNFSIYVDPTNNNVGINTSDFSYTTSDNSRLVGANTNNRLFVNGSIQLLGNNDAIVIGRGTATFLTDEELGFGWGGGLWMNDATYLRIRNNKHVYNEGIYSGSRFQNFSSSYDAPNLFMVQAGDTNWAFGASSNNSNTFWMQAKYAGNNDNLRGFRVLEVNSGIARMSVADKITTHQNTFYRTFQSYSGSDNNPVKTWDGVLVAGSDSASANTYTIIDTGVPQDSYMMGGFTIEWFENYYSTNGKTSIKLGGYWNPESNGGFLGWEYTTSNPNITPTIQIARNSSTGNTAFILSHFNSSYAIVVARDLWLGYSGGAYDYGHGWTIRQQSDTSGYTNLDTVVARAAASSAGLNADTLDGLDSTQFLRRDVSTSWSASNGPIRFTTPAGASGANTGEVNTLQIYQANVNTDAYMSFHVSGDYAAHFGLDGSTNDLFYGGWSTGGQKYRVYHAGNTDLNLIRETAAIYKWNVSANGTQARRWTIMRLYGTPNHWGSWQNIEITLSNTYFNGGYVKYYLYGYYGMGNGNSWILQVKDAGGVGTGYMRVSLGTVTYAGFTSGGQNTYYQDVYVDVDYYSSVTATASFYTHGYQTATPGAESYTLTQLYTSPAVANITYSNDDKGTSYLFGSKIWNAGNDGAGSGLDADLLDGLNGSDYWTKSGSWWGSGFNGSRLQGVNANGGEFTLIQDHPNTSQISVLIDGEYYAGENNGFMMVPSNTYSSRRGMRWNGSQIDFTVNEPQVLMSTLILPQNPVGQAHAGVSTQPSYYIGQQRGNDDAWKIYGESPAGTNTGALILQSEDDFDSNESIRLRFKRTYGSFNTSDVLIANFDRVTTISHRSNIYYDSDDTTYFLDPNSSGSLLRGRINVTGGHGASSIRTYLASGENGAGTGQVTLQMWCSEPGNTWDGAGFGYNVDNNLNEGGNVPAYYFGRPNTSHGQAYMRMTTNGEWNFYNTANGSNTRYTTMRLSNTGFIENYVSIRSPIFYDQNDTAYYADPNSTSNFVGLTVANKITGYIDRATRIDDAQRTAFTVGGNASTYYPVVFNIGAGATGQQYGEFMIERGGYDDPGYTGIGFTTSNIRFTVKSSGWGFGATYENVEGYYTTYSVLANWQQISESSRLIVWLRGGPTIYYFYNIVGNTTLHFANNSGGNYVETNGTWYTYTFTPTTTVQPRAQHGQYFNTGVMYDGSSRFASLGVGTNASGTTGEIRATNEVTAFYSDRRLKENIEVISNAIEKVKKLHGVTYTANELAESYGYDRSKRQAGLIADEVESVLPEVVRAAPFDIGDDGESKSGENYKTVQYEKVVPLLVEAIKEQQQQIESQDNRLTSLETRINKANSQ